MKGLCARFSGVIHPALSFTDHRRDSLLELNAAEEGKKDYGVKIL
jgi:hypothetical protein